jgi:hypothetical protein
MQMTKRLSSQSSGPTLHPVQHFVLRLIARRATALIPAVSACVRWFFFVLRANSAQREAVGI